jgi:hypothetical protein
MLSSRARAIVFAVSVIAMIVIVVLYQSYQSGLSRTVP